jgi:adenine-specific DNA-methyltransferase
MEAIGCMGALLELQSAVEYARQTIHESIVPECLLSLQRGGLLPAYGDLRGCFLPGDIDALAPLLRALAVGKTTPFGSTGFFDGGLPAQVCVGRDTWMPLGDAVVGRSQPEIYPALRHLANMTGSRESEAAGAKEPQLYEWLGGTCIKTSAHIGEALQTQVARLERVAAVGAADFARTAYYMGTKRELGPFLVEALTAVLPDHGVVLDLMCGSGAASGAFCRSWRTYASDAQTFSRLLAVVQGGGYSHSRVASYLPELLVNARRNERELQSRLGGLLLRESELCHSDLTPDLVDQFRHYVAEVQSHLAKGDGENIVLAGDVSQRLIGAGRLPYELFSTYFSTVFFGLRQAIEIDSLRFAIEQVENVADRKWALGALLVATSVRATTYAAHFAQPPIRDHAQISLARVGRVLETWAGSIYHEFAARLNHLSHQSESAQFPVEIVAGPWASALEEFGGTVAEQPVVVYLDAPYTREEYSRYYHVLETLVRYDYPSAMGRGKVPSKARAERFASELFTRTREKMEDRLVGIIRAILARGWTCAWSYSNTGRARIPVVLESVWRAEACCIESFAAPHRYVSQRGRGPKEVTEYLILFVPKRC